MAHQYQAEPCEFTMELIKAIGIPEEGLVAVTVKCRAGQIVIVESEHLLSLRSNEVKLGRYKLVSLDEDKGATEQCRK